MTASGRRRARALWLVAGLDPLGSVEREGRVRLTRLALDRLEQEAPVIAELDPLDDPAGKPVLKRRQDRHALGSRPPVDALELVERIASLATEQLGQLGRLRCDEVHGEHACPAGDAKRVVLVRQAGEEARRMDRDLRGEADQAAGAFLARRRGDYEHRVVELRDELGERGGTGAHRGSSYPSGPSITMPASWQGPVRHRTPL